MAIRETDYEFMKTLMLTSVVGPVLTALTVRAT